ncbi:hypothetical protein PWEIH_02424 [Listeria weihenstephanensis FSL R9-0317]|uniref:Uncharacterized protein n=1 Tax=Listeria weihenstephanensis TaxID=1006155 RepID=A0A1S7FS31_9LIST|nr:hypothetical protein [Listeria weihenstephanensis]AQY50256.1 hypothetical protein UE46_03880 [Listeria weihenstephanensis]EUJ40865.1 hypothetical protein PWEIH_02424 [Listeria weihenstephanensis FSL R9-0317]MBC1500773.1 hypothetical protein [Listeria weihenstephanensis]
MRFIFAYLTVFILGIFSVIGMEAIMYGEITYQLVFAAILFAAPLILVGTTVAEMFYGFSQKATAKRFIIWGFLFGVIATVIITSILQLISALMVILTSLLGGVMCAILAWIFFAIRGGQKASGKAATNSKSST